MAKKTTQTAEVTDIPQRRWMKPNKRAKGYAEERKLKVHMFGKDKGQELDDYNKGLRSGYLLCQSDHAGMFRYKKAMEVTKNKEYAQQYSREKGTEIDESKKAA